MLFQVGDLVTRDSYNNDLVFKIMEINDNIAYLKGVDIRLYADSNVEDLRPAINNDTQDEDDKIVDLIDENINR